MKKKISIFLSVLIAAVSLVGCSGTRANQEVYDTETMQATAQMLIDSFSQMDEAAFAQLKGLEDLSDFQLEVQMLNMGLNVSGEDFLSVIRSWEAAVEECGEFVKIGEFSTEIKSKEIVISAVAQFRDRDANVAFSFNKKGMLQSMDIGAIYTRGEILTKAGLNTVLGMGVVFGVLMFLALVISMMKYIPALLEGKGKTQKRTETEVKEETAVASVAATANTASEDELELVAVITAAIAMQEGVSPDGFVVRSIRRRPSNNWK